MSAKFGVYWFLDHKNRYTGSKDMKKNHKISKKYLQIGLSWSNKNISQEYADSNFRKSLFSNPCANLTKNSLLKYYSVSFVFET